MFLIFLLGCEDKGYIQQTYDKTLASKEIECLQLEIEPFSHNIYSSVKQLYHFDNSCLYKLKIKYKTNIVCNSPYNKNSSFHKFIQLSVFYDNKLFWIIYKDLKDSEDVTENIKKAYQILCKHLKIK